MQIPSLKQRESNKMRSVQAPIIPVVGALPKEYPVTISLGQGVVFYDPPPEAIESLTVFQSDISNHQYKSVAVIPPLLKSIEEKLFAENKIEVHPTLENFESLRKYRREFPALADMRDYPANI